MAPTATPVVVFQPPPIDPNGCPLDALTGQQLRPSGAATAVFVLCTLGVVLGPLTLLLGPEDPPRPSARRRVDDPPAAWGAREWGLAAGAVALECVGLAVYYQHHRRCTPLLGWFCFAASTVPAGVLWRAVA